MFSSFRRHFHTRTAIPTCCTPLRGSLPPLSKVRHSGFGAGRQNPQTAAIPIRNGAYAPYPAGSLSVPHPKTRETARRRQTRFSTHPVVMRTSIRHKTPCRSERRKTRPPTSFYRFHRDNGTRKNARVPFRAASNMPSETQAQSKYHPVRVSPFPHTAPQRVQNSRLP